MLILLHPPALGSPVKSQFPALVRLLFKDLFTKFGHKVVEKLRQ